MPFTGAAMVVKSLALKIQGGFWSSGDLAAAFRCDNRIIVILAPRLALAILENFTRLMLGESFEFQYFSCMRMILSLIILL